MLKGISPLINPELLKTLAEMGHGDEIVIGDGNFPAASINNRCLRCDGHGVTELLDAILQLMPLDTFADANVMLMEIVPGSLKGNPPIWKDFSTTIKKHDSNGKIAYLERFAFYEQSKKAYAAIQTGEKALYACIILKKGVL